MLQDTTYIFQLFLFIKKLDFMEGILEKYQPTYDFQQAFLHKESGNYVMKYSSGHAIAMAPFFCIAHLYCSIAQTYPADGFSYPYQLCIGIGLFLYGLIGIFLLRKVLLHYFNDSTVAIVLLSLVIGSNYLNYSSIDQSMTHSLLFTVYCLIILSTIKFYEKPSISKAIIIGSLIGFATLTRPTDLLSILIPLLWNINTIKDVKAKYKLICQHFTKFFLMALSAFGVFSIQMIYWKWVSGSWLIYSYESQGFSWFSPHILDYLFSYRCGWWMYCPLMILPFLGIWFYIKSGVHKSAIVGFAIINLYIVSAWDVWDYGLTGGRAMVQSYPILAFLLALLIQKALKQKWRILILSSVIVFCAYINLWYTYHAHAGEIHASELSEAYYWKVIGTWKANEEDQKLLDNPEIFYGNPEQFTRIYQNNFETDTTLNFVQVKGNSMIRLNKDLQFTEVYSIARTSNMQQWIRVSADYYSKHKEWINWKQAQCVVEFKHEGKKLKTNMLRIPRFIQDKVTKTVYIDALVPKDEWDTLSIYFWNSYSDKEIFIDNLSVISFNQ
jgi:hypothetical protein